MNNQEEIDLTIAIQLQEQFEEEIRQQKLDKSSKRTSDQNRKNSTDGDEVLPVSLVDPAWEMIDPIPDVHSLFCTFNDQFFWGKLFAVSVSWSPRMTVCAGVCSYERRGGLCSIRLSVPLLKLRPRKDLIETLLHEMIHAYLFVTANNRDRDGHGPEFHKHMYRINAKARTKISVYHSFHDEVAVYKQHVWQCNGPCRKQKPYYGMVKRSMNRAPGKNDRWWAQHKSFCNGEFIKIKEPEGFGTKRKAEKAIGNENKKNATSSEPDIRKFFGGVPSTSGNKENKKISSLGTKNSGQVKQLDVKNAKKGNIFGFTKSISSPVNAKGNQSSSSSSSKKTNGGGGLKLAGGSGTFVINAKKSETTSETKTSETMEDSSANSGSTSLFAGTGSTVGSSNTNTSRPVSRLLAEYDKSVAKLKNKQSEPSCSSNEKPKSSKVNIKNVTLHAKFDIVDSDDDDFTGDKECPLCTLRVPSDCFDEHIANCCGDWQLNSTISDPNFFSEESSGPSKTKSKQQPTSGSLKKKAKRKTISNSESNSDRYLAVSDSDEEFSEYLSRKSIRTVAQESTESGTLKSNSQLVECPVCFQKLTSLYLSNVHIDTHF